MQMRTVDEVFHVATRSLRIAPAPGQVRQFLQQREDRKQRHHRVGRIAQYTRIQLLAFFRIGQTLEMFEATAQIGWKLFRPLIERGFVAIIQGDGRLRRRTAVPGADGCVDLAARAAPSSSAAGREAASDGTRTEMGPLANRTART